MGGPVKAAYASAGWAWSLAALVGVVYVVDLAARYGRELAFVLLNGSLLVAFPLVIGAVFLRAHRTVVVRVNAAVALIGGWAVVIALSWASPLVVVAVWLAGVALAFVALVATFHDWLAQRRPPAN
jgi:hypothetical protein